MQTLNPIQLSLLARALDPVRDESQILGLWLGPERWLQVKGQAVSAYVFFHFQKGGEAAISIRADHQRIPCKVHGRWWIEGPELVVALGEGEIRGRYQVGDEVLSWADEILLRRSQTTHGVQPLPALEGLSEAAALL